MNKEDGRSFDVDCNVDILHTRDLTFRYLPLSYILYPIVGEGSKNQAITGLEIKSCLTNVMGTV